MFALLARLAPVHYKVDEQRWLENREPHLPTPNCAPLIDIRRMQGNADCHACGRCSGQRGAVQLSARSPNAKSSLSAASGKASTGTAPCCCSA